MRRAPALGEVGKFPVTGGVIALAILVSGLQWQGRDTSALHEGWEVMDGEVWRLVTSIFPHGDVLHLAFNLYWTWVLGALVELKWGAVRAGALIVFLGLVSGGMQYALDGPGQGLSGVGYGLFGLFWAMRGLDRDADLAADKNTAILFLGWGILCVIGTWAGTMQVANVAHGMGLVAGMVVGKAVVSVKRKWRWYYWGVAVALVPVTLVLASVGREFVNVSGDARWDLMQLAEAKSKRGDTAGAVRAMERAGRVREDRRYREWMQEEEEEDKGTEGGR